MRGLLLTLALLFFSRFSNYPSPSKNNSKFHFDLKTVDNKSHHVDCPLLNSEHYYHKCYYYYYYYHHCITLI